MDNYIGKRIEGRYEITELIGVGGMANVYKAIDITDKKIVAVKLLREEFYSNEELLRRFKNESKAIAVLSHPNIIKVYDVCFSNKMQSIVMEYVDGITLKEYLEQQGTLSWKEALHFTVQILKALSHAHEKGIVHRDIKPQNVMLLSDGRIKITDFGIARFARSEARTLTDRAIGSVHYISPEQARGEHTDQRADIYSVGVMLFEMLTGQLPFDADSPVSVALKQIQLEAPTPRSINPLIPEGLEEITVRAMQKDPSLRYQSAGGMLSDIEAFKQNPTAHFEYKYLSDEQLESSRRRRAIRNVKEASALSQKAQPDRRRSTPPQREPRRSDSGAKTRRPQDDYEEEERSGSVMMVLAGITAAFVVISIAFIATMLYLNNPLEKVPDVKVPDLIGLQYDEVRSASVYQDFVIEVQESQYNAIYGRGAIIEQSPKEGKTVKKNSTIKVVLSNGQKTVLMPNLVGLEETVAYQRLAEQDLEYQKVEVFSEVQSAGLVVSTEPGADSEIPAGTVVKVNISMGPENRVVAVPPLVGLPLATAKQRLTEAGLKWGGISYVVSSEPYETVLYQDPASTSQLATGGMVNLNVSGGERQQSSITLNIPLPEHATELATFKAVFDGTVLLEDRLQPSEAKIWRPAFQGTGLAEVIILCNDFLYMTVDVDFETGTWSITQDNSAMHFTQ